MLEKNTMGYRKVEELFDEGTFAETGAYIRRPGDNDAYEGVICGYGSVSDRLVFAFIQDCGRKKGAFDATGAAKICDLYNKALANGAPVIGVFDSDGAVVTDGSAVLSAYGKVLCAVNGASGRVPQIALVSGVCSGLSAVIASGFDMIVAVNDASQLYIKNTVSISDAYKKGTVARVEKNEEDAVATVRRLTQKLPRNSEAVCELDISDDAGRSVDIDGKTGDSLIRELADNNEYIALYSGYADGMITGLAGFGGQLSGVIATDAAVNGGAITPDGAKKAVKLLALCTKFAIPVVTFADSCGFSDDKNISPENYSELANAYMNSSCSKITLVTGKAYGAAFTLLGSRALGADMVYALPESVVSSMSPDAAVAFLWNDRINSEVSRSELESEWVKQYATAEKAAEHGDIDDIIAPEEARARICSALYMSADKSHGIPKRRV